MQNQPPSSEMSLAERELEIVLAIDRVRDTAQGPQALFAGIVGVLADRFRADLCLLQVINRETGHLELRAKSERGPALRLDADHLLSLAQQAMQGEGVVTLQAEVPPGGGAPADLAHDLHVAAIPIVLVDPLGVALVARAGRPFDVDEIELLKAAEGQMDSAVIQSYTWHDLAQRNKELETLYRVDHIRDENLPFDDMLNTVLQELCTVVNAQAGVVMLYNYAGKRLELRAVAPQDFMRVSANESLIRRAADEALERAEIVCLGQPTSVMCVPLVLRDEIIGVLSAVRHDPHGFTSDERRLLHAIVSQMDTAIFEGLERGRLRRVLGRSLDSHVMERLLANPNVDILKGERLVLSVLYSDLRGSTSLAEQLNPDVLVEFMNDYLARMANVVLDQGGTLDKFVGDEVMALFGAPFAQADHALRSVQTGLAMQAAFAELMAGWQARGIQTVGLGVGIATGELIAGEFGCEQRTDYTVIGRAANLGARICAGAHAGQVLISQATYDLVKDWVEVEPVPGQHFKGIDHEVTVYQVTRLLKSV
jgi:adenylate cyclase